MSQLEPILRALEQNDPSAAEQLLPLVYDELRQLAAARLAREKPGQTLDATALVHEAYLRLVGKDAQQHWDGRGHFFAACAVDRGGRLDLCPRLAETRDGKTLIDRRGFSPPTAH